MDLESSASIIGIKNKDSMYHKVSKGYVDMLGLKNINYVIKRKETDVIQEACYKNRSAKSIAEDFIMEDEIVMRGSIVHGVNYYYFQNQIKSFLYSKTPYQEHNGKIVGIFCTIFQLHNLTTELFKSYINSPIIRISEESKLLLRKNNLLIEPSYNLTHQEIRCLKLLCKGLTARQIANQLCLSKRTVEHYIDHIKDKLNVNRTIDIIRMQLESPIF